jgi:5-methyltetrahydrofolate--homocysteine methyltransferase
MRNEFWHRLNNFCVGYGGDDLNLSGLLERHRAFWQRSPVDRPLIGLPRGSYFPLTEYNLDVTEGSLHPSQLCPAAMLQQYDALFSGEVRMGDLFWIGSPVWGVPWLEAIAGCPVQVLPEAKVMSARPVEGELGALPKGKVSLENPWFAKLLEFIDALGRHSAGRFPISTPLMRGPGDILEALLGTERMVYAVYDEPEQVRALALRCADLYIEVARAQLERIPAFHGGYCSFQKLWAPGPTVMTQQDAAFSFTPAKYRELLRPADRKVIESFEYTIMHLHSVSLHTLSDLLELDRLACIQIVVDPSGPSLQDLLATFSGIQQRKSLVVFGDFRAADMDLLLGTLSPTGLCIVNQHADEQPRQ